MNNIYKHTPIILWVKLKPVSKSLLPVITYNKQQQTSKEISYIHRRHFTSLTYQSCHFSSRSWVSKQRGWLVALGRWWRSWWGGASWRGRGRGHWKTPWSRLGGLQVRRACAAYERFSQSSHLSGWEVQVFHHLIIIIII